MAEDGISEQDYPFEMLCIDDGSGDDTGDGPPVEAGVGSCHGVSDSGRRAP